MYLLFLDESGTHDQSPAFVLAGLAIHESDAYFLQRTLNRLVARKVPRGADPSKFELHANDIKTPRKKKRISEWAVLGYGARLALMNDTYQALAAYTPRVNKYPVALFGAVVDARYKDREERAYEEVLHRFDEMLTRQGHEAGDQNHQVGLIIHDERVIEKSVQSWTDQWRHAAGRIGTLTHLAEIPLFADSRASRLIQMADFVAWALWRYYGLSPADERWIKPLWPLFDCSQGVMHGLVHVHRDFQRGSCGCPPCVSRGSRT